MSNTKLVSVNVDIVSFLKNIADETNSSIASVANYYLNRSMLLLPRAALAARAGAARGP